MRPPIIGAGKAFLEQALGERGTVGEEEVGEQAAVALARAMGLERERDAPTQRERPHSRRRLRAERRRVARRRVDAPDAHAGRREVAAQIGSIEVDRVAVDDCGDRHGRTVVAGEIVGGTDEEETGPVEERDGDDQERDRQLHDGRGARPRQPDRVAARL
jgi:hypothetical protein